ncbi:MAG: tRNA threonylcarbamoyladenosine biosynthesis protein [Fusobacteria bacterium]|nr:MAG: tRNA threonylcarbamoyladenosine biosynthesis protein [Fusobacteriota bacterium]KAF0228893.1 MAG: tRNA threonylcarbamoyladenosine biosynthesis [Fusobacteriota bacterium]
MKTKYYDFQEIIDEVQLDEIIKAYKDGEVIAFPTETVYGLGANIYNDQAIKKIYRAKNRPADNPLIAHIGNMEQLYKLVEEIPEKAQILIDTFWPGPLTIIFKKNKEISEVATAGLETLGVRMPDHLVIETILVKGDLILVAPSANISGSPSPTTMKHVADDLDGLVYGIIDGGNCDEGIESTIVDMTGDNPVILRPGTITREDLEEEIGKVEIDESLLGASTKIARAPGMKYKHYAPNAKVHILKNRGDLDLILKKIKSLDVDLNKCALINFDENIEHYRKLEIPNKIILGSIVDLRVGIRNLFRILRDCDILGIEHIFIEDYKEEGLGFSYMNRLKKAANHNYLKES